MSKGFRLAPAILVLVLTSCWRDLPRVDMNDTIATQGGPVKADGRPALRIAVGAMISPETTRDYYEDLLRLIADRMGRRAVFAQRRTYAEVNAMVAGKEVDLAFVCSGPYVQGHDEFGMEILAVPVVHGEKVYHSYIVVQKDSPFESLDDLRGRRFAFTDPISNAGHFVPCYMLAQRGETPESFFSETFYSRSHDDSLRSVADGLADGAAVHSLVWDFMYTVDPSFTSRIRIIGKSPPYGIPPVVVHPGLEPNIKRRLKELFLSLHEDKEAAPLLRRLLIDRFEEGKDGMYNTVRDVRRAITE